MTSLRTTVSALADLGSPEVLAILRDCTDPNVQYILRNWDTLQRQRARDAQREAAQAPRMLPCGSLAATGLRVTTTPIPKRKPLGSVE